MPEIILKNITKKFSNGFAAVSNLNMLIPDRSFITLLGPSGCGKTTTLRMIAGLETPTSGVITIDGKTVFDAEQGINLPPDKRNIGFLFQNYALWPHMTVYKNISFGLENLKWGRKEIDTRVTELLKLLKIEAFSSRYPAELSGGQQQRVAIARTLAPRPRILFMDEPLSNLDAKLRGEMRTELKRMHIDSDSTFIYVTHDQLEAMTLSSKVCLIEGGILQQYAPPLAIYSRPENVFVADFMGNPPINFLETSCQRESDRALSMEMYGVKMRFISEEPIAGNFTSAILGIRPEHIEICQESPLKASVYATLPTGMETTVKLTLGQGIVSSVVFGSVDYEIDQEVPIRFIHNNILLFDTETKQRIGLGHMEIL